MASVIVQVGYDFRYKTVGSPESLAAVSTTFTDGTPGTLPIGGALVVVKGNAFVTLEYYQRRERVVFISGSTTGKAAKITFQKRFYYHASPVGIYSPYEAWREQLFMLDGGSYTGDWEDLEEGSYDTSWPDYVGFQALLVSAAIVDIYTLTWVFPSSEPSGTIKTPASGTGIVSGSTTPFEITLPDGFVIDSLAINGVDQGVSAVSTYSSTIINPTENIEISVVTRELDFTAKGTISYTRTNCPVGSIGVPITEGGSVSFGREYTGVYAPGSTATGILSLEMDRLTGIYASAFDARTRISSFIVNGVDILFGDPPLTSFFKFASPNAFSGGIHFYAKEAVEFSVAFSSDRFCYSVPGQLPAPVLPTTGIPKPPTDPTNPFYLPPPPTFPFDKPPGTGSTPGAPKTLPPWWPWEEYGGIGGGGRSTDGTTGEGGTPTTGGGGGSTQFGDPGGTFGQDREVFDEGKGFWIQWRDQLGRWSKEKYVSLGSTGQYYLCRTIGTPGQYRARQYRVIMESALPFTLVYMEEQNHVTK